MPNYQLSEIEDKLKSDPTNPRLWYEKGMAYAELDEFEKCVPTFSMGLIYNPFDPDLYLQRGRKYITADDYISAIADLTMASRLNPSHWENWYYQGVAAYMCGKYALCMTIEQTCIDTMEKHGIEEIPAPACWYWQAAMKLGLRDEAQRFLEKYIYDGVKCGNMDYIERCYLYMGLKKAEDFLDLDKLRKDLAHEDRPDLYFITLVYGLATVVYYNGNEQKANELLMTIYNMPTWHECFAYKQTLQDLIERKLL